MFFFPNELTAFPDEGQLPISTRLRFVARSLTGPTTVDVLYRMVGAENVKIEFGSVNSTDGSAIVEAPQLIRLRSIRFTGLFRSATIATHLVSGQGTEDPALVVIRAALVTPGSDDANFLAATSDSVRITQ